MTIFSLANYIINKYPDNISPMKLQKLLYYIKVWGIVTGKNILSESFYAWKYGPVNKEIYHTYKQYGSKPIDYDPFSQVSIENQEFVDFILDSYAPYNAIELSKTTHVEEPWIINKDMQGEITEDQILNYYSNQPFASNFPFDKSKPYYPPKTAIYYSFVFDMNEDDEAANITFSSIQEYTHLMSGPFNILEELDLS